jgi:putative FmdB family regulatory protein
MHGSSKDLVVPTYSYKCTSCSKIEDIVHGINDQYNEICDCGGDMNKVFYPAGVSFKGSGFYINDSKKG